ncbi:protein kinase [Streptomyces sp. NPDC088747]|uniref:serine/threonine-protein kinase n=1 Tax=Streptomyces sp. NPDC088747 TaxID=3365886 RepID=UPI003818EE1D
MQGVLLAERFRIRDRLGAGGMGQVWSAQDERMRRDVAVKIVHPQFGMDEAETQARFQREVQLAGRLSHQNIVTVHDWGEVPVDGRHTLYLVMELVPGVPLHKRFRESLAPWPLAVGWAAQISRALDAAHGRGVVHRDIKPANVLLTPEGTVKVLDFGVAKFMGETIGARDLTVTGAPLGSPAYMSPEQAEGLRDLDHRSDLYSLGCLLYHAVTGRPPFASTTQWAVLRMQMEDTPPAPDTLVDGLPGGLNDLILSLLAKRPADRPPDAAAVFDALCTVLVDHAVTLPGGDILDAARLGQGEALSGRLLDKAWGLWRSTERQSAVRWAEARDSADRVRAEALAAAERLATEGAETLTAAQEEAAWLRREAEELLGSARREINQQLERTREENMELLASTSALVEDAKFEAVRMAEEAEAGAERMRDAARREAVQQIEEAAATAGELLAKAEADADELRTTAQTDADKVRDEAIERATALRRHAEDTLEHISVGADKIRSAAEADAGRLRAEARDAAERLIANAVAESERIRGEDGRAADGPFEAAPRTAAERLAARAFDDAEKHAGPVRPQAGKSPPFGFQLVRRGYVRDQVDKRIPQLVADRDSALARVAVLEGRAKEKLAAQSTELPIPVEAAWRQAADIIAAAYARADLAQARLPRTPPQADSFELARRGYDREQVDERVALLVADRDSALARAAVLEGLIAGRPWDPPQP